MQMHLVQRATLAPSKCALCGAHDGEMIDTGIRGRLPQGAIYICVNRCLSDMIRETGGLSGNGAAEVRRLLGQQRNALDVQATELRRLRSLERAVASAGENLTPAA